MSVKRVATRYAKSLLDLAVERNELEVIYQDILSFHDLTSNRDFYNMLKSPVISGQKKLSILDTFLKGNVQDLTMAFLRILVNKGREAYLPEIAQEFIHQYKVLKHISTVHVTTATPLTPALLTDIKQQLKSSGLTEDRVELVTHEDPKLIGGFILEFDGKIFDASVASKLKELRQDFSRHNVYVSKVVK